MSALSALDLIVNVLKDHERRLSELMDRLEDLTNALVDACEALGAKVEENESE